MSKVIAFPTKDVRQTNLYNQLCSYHALLDNKYKHLDKLHGTLNDLEIEAQELEQDYDGILAQYAELVGVDNLEVVLLQYSSEAIIEVTGEKGNFTIRWDGGEPLKLELDGEKETD